MKNLIITGYTGSGKSVIGREIADILQYDFEETAEIMHEVTGYKPAQVLKKYGIIRCRSEDELIFRKLTKRENTVIAVDNLLTSGEGLGMLKPNGFFVFLSADTALLYKRVQKRGNKHISTEQLTEHIRAYEKICRPYIDYVLKVGEYGIEKAASMIIKKFRKAEAE